MYFVIGFCGALACLSLFGLGAAVGWNVCRLTRKSSAPAPQIPQEAQDEQDAFRKLQNYGVADAYGLNQQEG